MLRMKRQCMRVLEDFFGSDSFQLCAREDVCRAERQALVNERHHRAQHVVVVCRCALRHGWWFLLFFVCGVFVDIIMWYG